MVKKNHKNRFFWKDLNFGSKFKKHRMGWCQILMKKSTTKIIGVAIALVLGITTIGMLSDELIPDIVNTPTSSNPSHPDGISSGPLTLTKPTFKIYENIFYIVDGLREDEKGNIRFFVPDGRLYRTTAYDGAIKSSFSLYFRPDTSYLTEFCEQEEFIGEWHVSFDKNAYPELKFEIINEHLAGPGNRLDKAC